MFAGDAAGATSLPCGHGVSPAQTLPQPADATDALMHACSSCDDAIARGCGAEALEQARAAVEEVRGLFGTVGAQGLQLLGSRLAEVQRMLQHKSCRIVALQVAHDAMRFRRTLVGRGDQAALVSLAESLEALTTAWAELARYADAAAAAQNAVGVRRRLAMDGKADHVIELAASLCNLSRWRGRAQGDPAQALQILQEASTLLLPFASRGMLEARIGSARIDFAIATFLGDHHRGTEAILPSKLAVQAQRSLVMVDPQRFRPELAKALHNHAIWLSQVGRLAEAIETAEEAVALYRLMLDASQQDSLRNLAWSLLTLGNRQAERRNQAQSQAAYRECGSLLLRLPVEEAPLWAWLARSLVGVLWQPQDLRDCYLPLLCRLDDPSCPRADAVEDLRERVVGWVKPLLLALPAGHGALFDEGVAALLTPSHGAEVSSWVCAQRIGQQVLTAGASKDQRKQHGEQ